MSKNYSSSKIKGLFELKEKGIKVPDFDFISLDEINGLSSLSLKKDIEEKFGKIVEEKTSGFDYTSTGCSIRSASVEEDGNVNSAAGKYLTFNGVKTKERIERAVLMVLEDHYNKSENGSLCEIIIQKTHPSYISGVAFIEKRKGKLIITTECYFGSCKSVVEGICLPYCIVMDEYGDIRETGKNNTGCFPFYTHSELFSVPEDKYRPGELLKPTHEPFPESLRLLTESATFEHMVYGYRPEHLPEYLKDKICKELSEMAFLVEENSGIDIEWGMSSDGEMFFYQNRPVTSSIQSLLSTSSFEKQCSDNNSGKILHGVSGSSGKASGKVSLNNKDMKDGDVLLMWAARAEDYEAIEKASAVISCSGGILSHAAIVCRELGKPCVVGIETVISEGETVEVNGDIGCVRII